MRIGITFDLRSQYLAMGYSEEETAELDSEETIQAIEKALLSLGHQPIRIGNAPSLMECLLKGERWDLVFNIAEGLYGLGREALVPSILDAYGIPYTFSDPLVLSLTLHKAMAKRVARDLGVPTAPFCVISSTKELDSVELPYPLFLKPVAEGTGKGITDRSKVDCPDELREKTAELLYRYRQPVLVERYLSGREFTVGILGTGPEARAIGVMEISLKEGAQAHAYSYWNKEKSEEFVEYSLVSGSKAQEAAEVALKVWRGIGCRDAGRVDLREDESGRVNFLEVNPLAGLNPLHSDLPILCSLVGISYLELIGSILQSATKRIGG